MKSNHGSLRSSYTLPDVPPRVEAAFTLIELLVVLFIIALLMAILTPAVAQVRRDAMRATCRAQLRDIGQRFQLYLQDSRYRFPGVNAMPSVRPLLNKAPSIVELLAPYTRGAGRSYLCPADRITKDSPGSPPGFDTYFDREGSSYQYNVGLAAIFAGRSVNDLGRPSNAIMLMTDYEPFHGRPGDSVAMNALYLDTHVADLTEILGDW